MMPKKRQTALDIAAKLPVADLLPLLARPKLERRSHPAGALTQEAWVDAGLQSEPSNGTRSLLELETENNRLREAIAQLSGSLMAQKSKGFAQS